MFILCILMYTVSIKVAYMSCENVMWKHVLYDNFNVKMCYDIIKLIGQVSNKNQIQ